MAEALATIAAFFTVGLRLCTAGNERWQAIDVVAFSGLCGWLRLLLTIVAVTITEVLLARLLLLTRIGLLLPGLELRLLVLRRHKSRFGTEVGVAVAVLTIVIQRIALGTLHWLLLLWLALPELLLCRCDEAEVVFGVLIVILGCDRIAGRTCVARKLEIFFRNVRSGSADLDVRSIGLKHPRHRVLAAPVVVIVIIIVVIPAAHALVVVRAVSHVVPFTDSGSW